MEQSPSLFKFRLKNPIVAYYSISLSAFSSLSNLVFLLLHNVFVFDIDFHFSYYTGYSSAQLPNVTVVVDGTGDYRSIVEAVGVIPNDNDTFFYIHIKAGFYYENVYIGLEKRMIVMLLFKLLLFKATFFIFVFV